MEKIKDISELTLEDMSKIKFISKEEMKKMTFAELAIYMENLNKLENQYKKLIGE